MPRRPLHGGCGSGSGRCGRVILFILRTHHGLLSLLRPATSSTSTPIVGLLASRGRFIWRPRHPSHQISPLDATLDVTLDHLPKGSFRNSTHHEAAYERRFCLRFDREQVICLLNRLDSASARLALASPPRPRSTFARPLPIFSRPLSTFSRQPVLSLNKSTRHIHNSLSRLSALHRTLDTHLRTLRRIVSKKHQRLPS